MEGPAHRFIARVDDGAVRDAFADGAARLPLARPAPAGAWAVFVERDGFAHLEGEPLAAPGSALADLYTLAAKRGLSPFHPPAVMAETAAAVADPGVFDPALDDLTDLPFVTVDEPHSRDLDQALYVERRGDGHTVWYAIADPAWCVRPGSALFDEALARGATYYLPGLTIPMLPRELSEGTVSLNPGVDRRAMVFEVALGPGGRVERARIRRARVRSRIKTSYQAVQAFYDGRSEVPGGEDPGLGPRIAASLEALREVGRLRLALAESRDVVAIQRREVAVSLGGERGLRFVALADPRHDVERYNEQISLLCNVEGARFLLEGDAEGDGVEPIYRIHDPPAAERLDELARQLDALVRLRGLDPERWAWLRGERSLADYLASLPDGGKEARLARAIHRQVMLTGGRSQFASGPGIHHGVGADVYGRFTAPMREVVGIFVHKEAWEKLDGGAGAASARSHDEALRERVIEAANRARQTQRELDREVNRRVLDQLFEDDLARPVDDRPRRPGTVLGISRSKVHVGLDAPPIDVKVYLYHLSARLGGRVVQGRDGVTLRRRGRVLWTVGDAVRLRVRDRDRQRDRWELELLEW